ncbi:tRNA threonylcarbamoyladenosine biosynthesis protein TsaE [Parelusimicrobium proximum]|uniref:tRNA (adenosine(37)-N6)-threonylcarbamoyltransferase complex ATPase subunit type 1 TsaE n=1 Tax=Parelusimicrobium proximum TaxID=3228953 RepID=UPI003D17BECE
MEKIFYSSSVSDTEALASDMAKLLKGGEIIFLRGPIGAGKTVFVRALAKALKLKGSPVSASFSLMKEYAGPSHTMFHVDLFRVEEREMFNFGFEEMLSNETAIIVAEWPDAVDKLMPGGRLEIDYTLLEGDRREIKISAEYKKEQAILEKLWNMRNK